MKLLILVILLSACASKDTASTWTPPLPARGIHGGPQCINGQQQLINCTEAQ